MRRVDKKRIHHYPLVPVKARLSRTICSRTDRFASRMRLLTERLLTEKSAGWTHVASDSGFVNILRKSIWKRIREKTDHTSPVGAYTHIEKDL